MAESGDKYSKFHSIPVKDWSSYAEGDSYKSYLNSTDKSSLTPAQKDDKTRLEEYEKGSSNEEESTGREFNESAVDYNRIKDDYGVAFYLSLKDFPDWLISSVNLNIRNYILSEFKSKSIREIVKNARVKLGLASPEGNKKEDNNEKEEKSETQEEAPKNEEKQETKKPSLFALIVKDKNKGQQNSRENNYHSEIEKYVDMNNKEINTENKQIEDDKLMKKEDIENISNKVQEMLDEEQKQ